MREIISKEMRNCDKYSLTSKDGRPSIRAKSWSPNPKFRGRPSNELHYALG